MERRAFFRLGLDNAFRVLARTAVAHADQQASKWFRPPFALQELAFQLACTRCDKCLVACPHQVLFSLPEKYGPRVAGTPVMNLWLRALGARIGRGVWCETYWLPEADLVTLGDGSTVNRGCVVQTHLFHDRIMRMDSVVIEDGATLGPHSVALPASRIGAGATVGPASLVMRGDEVPPSTRWQGNPIAPWPVSRRRARSQAGAAEGGAA